METTQQAVPDKSGVQPKPLVVGGKTIVSGLELVGEKIGAIISKILTLDKESDNFGLRTLSLRTDVPKEKLGISYPLAGAIVINLNEIWEMCVEDMQKGELKLGLQGHIWQQLLLTLLHEIHHVDACRDPEMLELIDSCKDDLNVSAEEWGQEIITDLAKEFDIEPVSLAEMEFFGVKLMEMVQLMQSGMVDNKPDEAFLWLDRELDMMEKGIIYRDEDNDIIIKSFREYRRGIVDPEGKDESWGKAVSVVDLVVDGKPVADEEPAKEPDVVELPQNYDTSAEKDEAEEAVVEQVMAQAKAAEAGELGLEGGMLFANQEEIGEASDEADMSVETAQALATGEATVPAFGGTIPKPAAVAVEPVNAPLFTPATTTPSPPEVPLPANVVQQNLFTANAAAGPTPSAPVRPQQYPVNNVDSERFKAFMKDVYKLLYTHIFTKCGWQLQNDQGFTNPAGVLEPVKLDHLEKLHGVKDVIMEYRTVNAQGQPIIEKYQGYVRGTVFTKSNTYGLPAYVLMLNFNGMQLKRSLVPQNPAKRDGLGQYKATAMDARTGHAIAWIMADGSNQWKGKIRDNVYEELN